MLQKETIKKAKIKAVIVVIVVIAAICFTVCWAVGSVQKSTAKQLAEYGEKRFVEEVLPTYILNLQKHGVDDLNVRSRFLYSYDCDYDKTKKSLDLECKLEFCSSHIDLYYSTGYNGLSECNLADVMKGIRSSCSNVVQTFTLEDIGTVTVSIYMPDHELSVKTPSDREYKLVYEGVNSVRVEIDGNWVYSSDETNTVKFFGEAPYVGLSKNHLNHTELGFYDDIEYCRDYYALRSDSRYATYIWHDAKGNKIFSAMVFRDKVIHTVDSRNGKLIISGPESK